MKSDIEIARSTELMKIKQIAQNYGIPTDQVHHYGSYMAKVSEALIDEEKVKQSNRPKPVSVRLPYPSGLPWD